MRPKFELHRGQKMKKLLTLVMAVLSVGFVASTGEAKTSESSATTVAANAANPQINVRLGGNNRRRNRRVVRTTRVSPNGRRIVTRTYRPNGRVVTRKRVIRRYRRY